MKKFFVLSFLMVFLLSLGSIVTAQPPQPVKEGLNNPPRPDNLPPGPPIPPPGGENMPPMRGPGMRPEGPAGPFPEGDLPAREVLEQVLLAKVAKQLKLNDEQTVLLVKKFNEQREVFIQKTEQRNRLANEIRKLIGNKPKSDTQELEEKFAQLLAMDKEIAELKQKWVDNLSMDLPLESKIQLYLLISDFENEVRKFLRKAYDWKQNRMHGEKQDSIPPEQRRFKIQNPENEINTNRE